MQDTIDRIRNAADQAELEAIAAEMGWWMRIENVTVYHEVTVSGKVGRGEASLEAATRCAMLQHFGIN